MIFIVSLTSNPNHNWQFKISGAALQDAHTDPSVHRLQFKMGCYHIILIILISQCPKQNELCSMCLFKSLAHLLDGETSNAHVASRNLFLFNLIHLTLSAALVYLKNYAPAGGWGWTDAVETKNWQLWNIKHLNLKNDFTICKYFTIYHPTEQFHHQWRFFTDLLHSFVFFSKINELNPIWVIKQRPAGFPMAQLATAHDIRSSDLSSNICMNHVKPTVIASKTVGQSSAVLPAVCT